MDEIVSALNTDSKAVVIHSDLGNGKSVIVREIESKLCAFGNVYYLEEISPFLRDDLDIISSQRGIKYVIVENYNRLLDSEYAELLKLYFREDFRFVFTIRTYLNENLYYRFTKFFPTKESEIALFDINQLTHQEIDSLYTLFEHYGLWGHQATWNKTKKKKYLVSTCKSEIKNVLIDLLKSKEMGRKLNNVLSVLFEDQDIKEITLFVFICSVISSDIDLSDVVLILGKQARMGHVVENSSIREFFDFNKNKIVLKSPIIASYVLQNTQLNEDVEELIKKILPILGDHSAQYENLLRMLISYSNLRQIFDISEQGYAQRFIRIFERAKLLNYHEKNPFFWLQYAMTCMDLKDYKSAELYLNNAASYASSKNFDSWQIETQRARLILEKTLSEKDYTNSFPNFLEAHSMIMECATNDRYYPYRQLRIYRNYYNCFFIKFDESQRALFFYNIIQAEKTVKDLLEIYQSGKEIAKTKNKKRDEELHKIQIMLKGLINDIRKRIHTPS